jgi:hypothetical protein
VFILFKYLADRQESEKTCCGSAGIALGLAYRLGSGRFCGGYREERVIQQGRYTGNNGDIGKVKHVPVVGLA